jgi:hypothetical protein
MFKISRYFSQRNNQTGLMEWFFFGRNHEGVFGPYQSEKLADLALKDYIQLKMRLNDDGGRTPEKPDASEAESFVS